MSGPMILFGTGLMTGGIFRTLNIIDEFTNEALAIRVKRKLNSVDVVDALTDLFIMRGPLEFIRSDNVLYRQNLAAQVSRA